MSYLELLIRQENDLSIEVMTNNGSIMNIKKSLKTFVIQKKLSIGHSLSA